MAVRARVLAGIAIAALLSGWLAACAAAPPASRGHSDADSRREIGDVLRVAFAGDSLTAGCSTELTGGSDPCSWTAAVDAAPGLRVVGGWAQWGAPASLIAERIEPVEAEVLVILAGTNDVVIGIPFDEQREAMDAIAAVVGAPEVAVVALPPIDGLVAPGAVADRNALLRELAETRGWRWLDPWAGFVGPGPAYEWADGVAPDGVHPDETVQFAVGERIADALLEDVPAG